jgi:hypothetical protein
MLIRTIKALKLTMLMSLAGCFGTMSKAIPLASLPVISDNEATTHRLTTSDGPLVVMALETCDARVNHYSNKANFRQLVAGFKGVRVERMDSLNLNGNEVTRAAMSCKENDRPIHLLTYSIRTTPCLTDIVSWREDGKVISDEGDSALKNFVISLLEKGNS